MRKFGAILLAMAVLYLSDRAIAATGDASFAFLRIGAGSRPTSLAEAVTAFGGDITSAYYNPSLLNSINSKNQVAFMYNAYFVDVTQNYLAFAANRNQYAIGGYMVLGGVPDLERRLQPSPEPIGTFDENYFVGSVAYAYRFNMFDLGLGLKYAYEKIDYESASSIMLDAGIYSPLTEEISVGAAVKNIGTRPKFQNKSYPLSREFRLGVAYRPQALNKSVALMADGVFFSDLDPKYNFGVEYSYKRYFSLRTGYGAGYDSRGLSFGGGIMYRQFNFDYAFVGYKNDLGSAHRFTLIASF